MTKNCVKKVLKLQDKCEDFNDLTIEQLLYACVISCGLEDTKTILETTDWKEWCPNVK